MTKNPHAVNKRLVFERMAAIADADEDQLEAAIANAYTDDAELSCFHPVNDVAGLAEIHDCLWQPLKRAMPGLERRDRIVAGGDFDGKQVVAAMGHYQGTFRSGWIDIAASYGVVYLRYGELHEIVGTKIRRSYVLIDVLDLLHQVGRWPIAPSLGAEGMWAGPTTHDGVALGDADPVRGAATLDLVKLMHGALLSFDGKTLDSMDHGRYWTPDFMWYGPSGIGTTRGLEGFRLHHQIPFLRAFPDRTVGKRIVSIGDGDYAVTGGWPSVVATHTGPDWLGLPPTGRRVNMRVMDFYRAEGALLAENWVPIDVIDILRQLGVDVLDRVRHRDGKPRRDL